MIKKKTAKDFYGLDVNKIPKENNSLVPVSAETQADQAQVEVGLVKKAFNTLPEIINNNDQSVAYADFMTKLATATKSVSAKEKSVTRHLEAAKKIVIDLFKPQKTILKGYRLICDERLLEYREHLTQIAEEKRRKEEEREQKRLAKLKAIEKKKLKAAEDEEEKARIKAAYSAKQTQVIAETTAAFEMIEDEPPEAPGVSFREVWDFDVIDIAEVPDVFVDRCVNRRKVMENIRGRATAGGSAPEIPGLEIFKKPGTAVRGS